jgi:hypothetical protein
VLCSLRHQRLSSRLSLLLLFFLESSLSITANTKNNVFLPLKMFLGFVSAAFHKQAGATVRVLAAVSWCLCLRLHVSHCVRTPSASILFVKSHVPARTPTRNTPIEKKNFKPQSREK